MAFRNDETGAVTVDWVVLTAALVGLGLAAMSVVSSGVETTSKAVESQLKGQTITTSFSQDDAAAWVDYASLKTIWYNDQMSITDNGIPTEANVIAGYENNINNVRTRMANNEQVSAYAEIERAVAYYDIADDNGYDLTAAYDNVGDLETIIAEFEAEYGCLATSC